MGRGLLVAFTLVVDTSDFVTDGWHDVRVVGIYREPSAFSLKRWALDVLEYSVYVSGLGGATAPLGPDTPSQWEVPGAEGLQLVPRRAYARREGDSVRWWAQGECREQLVAAVLVHGNEVLHTQYAVAPTPYQNRDYGEELYQTAVFPPLADEGAGPLTLLVLSDLTTGLGPGGLAGVEAWRIDEGSADETHDGSVDL